MNKAENIMSKIDSENPQEKRKKLSELEKGRLALEYIAINKEPHKYKYYQKFLDNNDDVKVPGYNSITGKHIDNDAIL